MHPPGLHKALIIPPKGSIVEHDRDTAVLSESTVQVECLRTEVASDWQKRVVCSELGADGRTVDHVLEGVIIGDEDVLGMDAVGEFVEEPQKSSEEENEDVQERSESGDEERHGVAHAHVAVAHIV